MAVHDLTGTAGAHAAGADRPGAGELLRVRDLEVVYGGASLALRGVSLSVPEGGAVAVLGANGAGKTTTIRAISGLLYMHAGRVVSGDVELAGESVRRLRGHQIVRRGVGQVPEGRMVFKHLSVEENLRVGGTPRRAGETAEALEQVYELFPTLRERRRDQAGWMSGGEQQMIAIGRALMGRPRLLLLDEVSLGLAPLVVETIFDRLREAREELGMAMLLVEQNARLALDFADHAYIMETGRIALQGPSGTLRDNPEVQASYLGTTGDHGRGRFAAGRRARPRSRWLS
jgi:branched-chain amino acid transport system ATP-binding protein